MRGFIVYPTYRMDFENAKIHLFGRLENGESFLSIHDYKPYFYIKKTDLEKAKGIFNFETEKVKVKDFKDNDLVKIVLKNPKHISEAKKLFENQSIVCYEADLRFPMRFLIDKEIQGSLNIEGEYKKGEYVNRIYENAEITPSTFFPRLKVLSFDIETDMKGEEVYCISIVCGDIKEVIIHSEKTLNNALSVNSERQLLEMFKEKVKEIDPDIITGWNLIDFDLKILQDKFRKYKIPFDLGREKIECTLRIESSFFKDSSADFPGRMVLDGIHLMKSSFIKLDDYKLGTAAQEFLGEEKLIGDETKGTDIENAFKENQQLLVDYNLKDSKLVIDILEKTKLIDLTIQRSLLTGMALDKVKASIAALDSLYLRELKKKGYAAYSAKTDDEETRITGGFVQESKPGIYDYIIVLDFKSLYPSIMRTFNIDPLSFVEDCQGENLIHSPNGACFRNEEGILPQILTNLSKQRDDAKKEKNSLASQAIKIHMNSFFGVLANPTCRFFSLKMANAITHFGQHIIKLSTEKVKELGYEVIYGDTDSIFVKTNKENAEDAKKAGLEIQVFINNFFNAHVKHNYNRECHLEIQFDKMFKVFMMPKVRHGEQGSKKRYVGLKIKEEGKEEIDFTGMEFVRRDWTDLAKNFQLGLFERVFRKEDVTDYVKNYVKELKSGNLDAQLVYRKSLRKGEDEYTKTTPPHVKAARMLEKLDSNIISYVMTIDGPQPIQIKKSRIDYEHYIEKQIKPLADAVLVFSGKSFDDLMKGTSQKGLGAFF